MREDKNQIFRTFVSPGDSSSSLSSISTAISFFGKKCADFELYPKRASNLLSTRSSSHLNKLVLFLVSSDPSCTFSFWAFSICWTISGAVFRSSASLIRFARVLTPWSERSISGNIWIHLIWAKKLVLYMKYWHSWLLLKVPFSGVFSNNQLCQYLM